MIISCFLSVGGGSVFVVVIDFCGESGYVDVVFG